MEDWHYCNGQQQIPEESIARVMKKGDLKVVFKQQYPRPDTDGVVVF
jgi:hypothetical protein